MSLFKNSLKLYSKNIAVIDDNGISISYKDLESFSDLDSISNLFSKFIESELENFSVGSFSLSLSNK